MDANYNRPGTSKCNGIKRPIPNLQIKRKAYVSIVLNF